MANGHTSLQHFISDTIFDLHALYSVAFIGFFMKFLWRGLWNKRKRKTNKNRKLFQVAILCSKALNTFTPLGLGGNILGFNERLLIGQNSSGREVGWGELKDNKYSVPDPKLLKVISVHPCKRWNYNQAGVGSPQKC